jgi:hypothetical protein
MLDSYKYLLATKDQKVLCIKYTDNVILDLFELLKAKGWDLEVSDRATYESQDLNGGKIQRRFYDANTKLEI